jgi:hypothetical protein
LSVSNAYWSILAWDSWKIPTGEHSQWLDIEIYKADNVALFAISQQLFSRFAFDTTWNRRSHVVLAETEDCPHCFVQVAALAWSTIPAQNSSPRTTEVNAPTMRSVPMNDLKKKGSIKTYTCCPGDERESIMFELKPCLRNEDSSTVSRYSWTRLLGISKSKEKRQL